MKQALYQEREEIYEAKALMIKAKLALQQQDYGRYTATIHFSAPRHGISLQIKYESYGAPYGFFSSFLRDSVKKNIEGILSQELLKDLHKNEIGQEIDNCITSLRDQYISDHSTAS